MLLNLIPNHTLYLYLQSQDSTYTPGTSPDPSPCNSPFDKEFPDRLPSPSPMIPEGGPVRFNRPRSSTLGDLPKALQFDMKNGHSTSVPSGVKVHELGNTPSRLKPGGSTTLPVSPLRTMFQKVNNSGRSSDTIEPPVVGATMVTPSPSNELAPSTPQRKMSWRLGILNRVVTPARVHEDHIMGESSFS